MTTGDKGAKHWYACTHDLANRPLPENEWDCICPIVRDELRAINAELLEALRNILADDEVRDGDLPQDLVNMAWSVIARAEGRTA